MIALRRFVAVAALGLWLGGGAFFGGVAIPIGRHVLRDDIRRQNLITRDATAWLNRLGVGALALSLWDLAGNPARERRLRAALWAGMALLLAAAFALHARMNELFEAGSGHTARPGEFRWEHRLYLAVNALLCLTGLGYLLASLSGWRRQDATGSPL
jgi:hypothetical protein